jgi:hypothetical protein
MGALTAPPPHPEPNPEPEPGSQPERERVRDQSLASSDPALAKVDGASRRPPRPRPLERLRERLWN